MTDVDLVIVGAGVAGLSLAALLKSTPLRIVMVEAKPFQKAVDAQHRRVSAYNIASQQLLQGMGVWSALDASLKSDFRHVEVWDARGQGRIEFDCTDVARPQLGTIVPNEAIVAQLLEQIEEADNCQLLCPATVNRVSMCNDCVTIELADRTLTSKLVVGADGANSWLRSHLSVPMQQVSYESSAFIATVRTEKPHQKTARQVFLDTGPLAFLPLDDPHTCSIVWSTTPDEAGRLAQLSKQDFCQTLTDAFQGTLGQVTECLDTPLVFPLTMRHVKHYVGQRFALVGDAAHTIHPLAGQGINLGLQDVAALASVIQKNLDQGRDFGLKQNLRSYERMRKGDTQLMIHTMQSFKSLFGSESSVVTSLRNAGLNAVNNMGALKRFFMQQAMG